MFNDRYLILPITLEIIKIRHEFFSNFRRITHANLFSLEVDFLHTRAEYDKSLLTFKQNPLYSWPVFKILRVKLVCSWFISPKLSNLDV